MKTYKFPERTIVLGGCGMVGSYIDRSVPNFCRSTGYDLTKPGVIEGIFEKEKPKQVILLAAMTNVVGAENDPMGCFAINSYLPYRTALLCRKLGAWLYFISSVDIFDGEKDSPYVTNDIPNPVVVYGHSKFMAESLIRGVFADFLIIRAGWMFGGIQEDKKFVSYMMKQIKEGKTISAVGDRVGSPTYAKDLVAFISDNAIERSRGITRAGTLHFCNEGKATRYLEARVIAEEMGIDPNSIKEAKQENFPNFRSLKNAMMVPSIKTRPWEEALREYIRDWRASEEI